jgi:nitric oxide reductase subunit B
MQAIQDSKREELSPWWMHAVVLIMVFGFTILIWRSVETYSDAPPIPQRAVTTAGETIFTHDDIVGGQNVFLKYGLMDNGTIWGHGAYLGPDFSADYLHTLSNDFSQSGLSQAEVQRDGSFRNARCRARRVWAAADLGKR